MRSIQTNHHHRARNHRSTTRILFVGVFAIVSALTTGPRQLAAQPDEPAEPPTNESAVPIEESIASALADRGQSLLESGDPKSGKKLFIESLEVSPNGPSSARALEGLQSANRILGVSDLNDGRPTTSKPVDPYADPDDQPSGDAPPVGPIDPYADPTDSPTANDRSSEPLDPYDQGVKDSFSDEKPGEKPDEPNTEASPGLMAWGGLYGATLGLAIGGPTDERDDLTAGSLLLGLTGAGAGVAAGYFGSRRFALSRGQVATIASAGNWGMWNFAFLGDIVTDEDTSTNAVFRSAAIGGLLGAGAGIYLAKTLSPSQDDVAIVNSLGSYGTAFGLFIAAGIDPPRSEAYSLNAVIGSTAGLGLGVLAARRWDMSRGRTLRIDLGAAAGAGVTWALIYPLIASSSEDSDEQFAGFFSTLTMAGGIGLAYYLTRNYDDNSEKELAIDQRYPPPMALVRRMASGSWRLGSPLLRPMNGPLSGRQDGSDRALSLGVDVLGGRF